MLLCLVKEKGQKSFTCITAHRRSCGKVMFLHLSVILFMEEGGLCPGGLCARGGVSVQGGLCQGDPPYGKEQAVRILLECILV